MPDSADRRVVITGLGLVSPLGNSPEALWAALSSGTSGVRRLINLPADVLPASFGAEAWDFRGEIEDFGPLEKQTQRHIKKGLKLMCREIEMGVAAAQLALLQAGFSAGEYAPDRTGVVYGSDYIFSPPAEFVAGIKKCIDADGRFRFERWGREGMNEVTPLWLLKYLPNMPASHIAIYNDLRGPNNSITLREASSLLAVGEAHTTIARGAADVIIAGATGTRLHPVRTIHISLQEQLAAAGDPAAASRPFDKGRTGAVLGEGAGAVVLEERAHAKARGATIYGEVLGGGSSTVISREGAPRPRQALANAMSAALRKGGRAAGDVGHVHAHGIATTHGDREEAAALTDVFGRTTPPVTAAKSYFGNLGAGSGLVELIASLLALRQGRLFPILNYETPDPECPIQAVRDREAPAGSSFIAANVTPQGQASAILVAADN